MGFWCSWTIIKCDKLSEMILLIGMFGVAFFSWLYGWQ